MVLAKEPMPGCVKTRLAADLGADSAARLYRRLAEATVRAATPRDGAWDLLVAFTPASARLQMSLWLGDVPLWPQPEGDLGTRLRSAVVESLARGAHAVALVGSDLPGLTRETLEEAFDALERADLVLGPALDGGYYLLALRQPHAGLFEGIAWSTSTVREQTEERARSAGLRVHTLSPLRDVDTLEDLRSEWPRIEPLLGLDEDLVFSIEQVLTRPSPDR